MGESVIFTSYFAMRPNPQGKNWHKNYISHIQPLYDSVRELGLNMIIFHDHLSAKFIRKYTTGKISFVKHISKCKIPTMARFLCYKEHLADNVYDKILCLDCGDLELYKDPFPLIGDNIMIGSEEGLIGDSVWVKDVFRKAYGKTYYADRRVLNCGILGGTYDFLFYLLILFANDVVKKASNIDMAVFNKLIYDGFKFDTGYPIHTIFGKEEGRESGCYIRHK